MKGVDSSAAPPNKNAPAESQAGAESALYSRTLRVRLSLLLREFLDVYKCRTSVDCGKTIFCSNVF